MHSFKINAIVVCALLGGALTGFLSAQDFDEQFDHWPLHTTIKGTLIIDNELDDKGKLFDSLRGLEDQKVLIIADRKLAVSNLVDMQLSLKEKGADLTVRFFDQFAGSLFKNTHEYSMVVIYAMNGFLDDKLQFEQFSDCDELICDHVMRGNTLIVNQPVAKMLCAHFTHGQSSNGANRRPFLLDCGVEFAFDNNEQGKAAALKMLTKSSDQNLRIGLTDDVAMRVSGRKVTVTGDGSATFMLPACEHLESSIQTIVERTSRRMPTDRWLVDLTQWQRRAMDRSLEQFPPEKPRTPFVENGTLVIVGGGGMPRGLMNDFIEYAGGKEKAKLVYVPCSEQDDVGANARTVAMWKRMGVEHATMIHTKDRNKANSDEEFLAPLKDATGIWFGGGRQWNFADSYYGTKAHKLMKDVLKRGGVIGGSSAGASIQARFLARATPIGNTSILAPGYERGGLGFISGVAIDQHFSQRRRQADMSQLVDKYPQMLGIGIDEATALIVQKSQGNVVGRGKVFFYDRNQPLAEGKPDYISLPAGSVYDLAKRKVVKDTTEQNDDNDDNE